MQRAGASRGARMSGVLSLLAWSCLAALPVAGADAPAVGRAAPALVVPQLDGQVFELAALRGSVVVVNFWATWCSPCRAEMPLLDSFYKRYRSQGLVLIGLSVDDRHDSKGVRRVMEKFSYPAALAINAKVDGFGAPLAVPMTWIIDSEGVVRARLVSAVTEQTLEQAVLPLLAAPAAAAH